MPSAMKLPAFIVFFGLSSLLMQLQQIRGEVICDNLPAGLCTLAVASSGKRCVLENYRNDKGNLEYTCTSSEVVVERLAAYIETDHCVAACGVDRQSVGISSDALLQPEFVAKLCSPPCYDNCRNIVDLYFNLAAGEGVFLPALCEKHRSNPHREMLAILSSGAAASADATAAAPTPAPVFGSPAPPPSAF
ncbi:uncharacterized protein LOC127239764 [Andrographis paniculata]|uniref:uncharacterized protein LOC127239764 n=1 Tax=Andrographis paniculata TaxID=175694 RepID=UPI0021E745DF|nr:uncharacterized protein LOC127239764 [Andrographis paniculata]